MGVALCHILVKYLVTIYRLINNLTDTYTSSPMSTIHYFVNTNNF